MRLPTSACGLAALLSLGSSPTAHSFGLAATRPAATSGATSAHRPLTVASRAATAGRHSRHQHHRHRQRGVATWASSDGGEGERKGEGDGEGEAAKDGTDAAADAESEAIKRFREQLIASSADGGEVIECRGGGV